MAWFIIIAILMLGSFAAGIKYQGDNLEAVTQKHREEVVSKGLGQFSVDSKGVVSFQYKDCKQ